jgi:uncharacterized membrane protein YgdD (TMEM256/DUF423 family)
MRLSVELNRPLLAVAALCGAGGVAVAAAASHKALPDLAIAGNFLQLHAPVLIGVSLLGANRIALVAGWLLVGGLVLFAGDLAAHSLLGASPVPIAAPLGGMGLILGWLLLAVAAFAGWRTGGA